MWVGVGVRMGMGVVGDRSGLVGVRVVERESGQ